MSRSSLVKSKSPLATVLGIMARLRQEDDRIDRILSLPNSRITPLMQRTVPARNEKGEYKPVYPYVEMDVKLSQLTNVHPVLPPSSIDLSFGCSLSDVQWVIAQKVATLLRRKRKLLVHDHAHICKFDSVNGASVCRCTTTVVTAMLLRISVRRGGVERREFHLCTPDCTVSANGVWVRAQHVNAQLVRSFDIIFCDRTLRYHVCGVSCSMHRATGNALRSCPFGQSSVSGYVHNADALKHSTNCERPKSRAVGHDEVMRHSQTAHFVNNCIGSKHVPFDDLNTDWPRSATVFSKALTDPDDAFHPLSAYPYWNVPREIAIAPWPPSKKDARGVLVVDERRKQELLARLNSLSANVVRDKGMWAVMNREASMHADRGLSHSVNFFEPKQRVLRTIEAKNANGTREGMKNSSLWKRAHTIYRAAYQGKNTYTSANLACAQGVIEALLFSEYRICAEESIEDSYYPIKYMRGMLASERGKISVRMWTLCIALEILSFRADVYAAVVRWGILPNALDRTETFVYFVVCELFSRSPSNFVQQICPSSYLPSEHIIAFDGRWASLGWVHGSLHKLTQKKKINVTSKQAVGNALEEIFRLEERNGGFIWSLPSITLSDVIEWMSGYERSVEPLPEQKYKIPSFSERVQKSVVEWFFSNLASAKRGIFPSEAISFVRDDTDFSRRKKRREERTEILKKYTAALSRKILDTKEEHLRKKQRK